MSMDENNMVLDENVLMSCLVEYDKCVIKSMLQQAGMYDEFLKLVDEARCKAGKALNYAQLLSIANWVLYEEAKRKDVRWTHRMLYLIQKHVVLPIWECIYELRVLWTTPASWNAVVKKVDAAYPFILMEKKELDTRIRNGIKNPRKHPHRLDDQNGLRAQERKKFLAKQSEVISRKVECSSGNPLS